MISRNLTKRLEQLEGRMLPPGEIHLLRVVYVDGPDRVSVGGYAVGPGYGPKPVRRGGPRRRLTGRMGNLS
jgi:hypothetical protein